MSNGILDDATMRIMRAALDGLALRQQVTGNNIANAETPGFKASVVRFEEQLQRALDSGRRLDGQPMELQLVRTNAAHFTAEGQMDEALGPRVEQISNTGGRNDQNNVDIDREMITLADTAIHYQALTRLLAKRFAMLKAAVTEGRG